MHPRILLTGFEPFGQANRNPSGCVVRLLRRRPPPRCRLHTAILPVAAAKLAGHLPALLDRVRPDAVLLLGEARGAASVRVERLAINLLAFRMRDNAGALIRDRPIVKDGPAAYWATLSTGRIATAIRRSGIPCVRSLNAGTFICNQAMYLALHWCRRTGATTRIGFVHLPSLPEQVKRTGAGAPSLPLPAQVRAVRAALRVVVAALSPPHARRRPLLRRRSRCRTLLGDITP